MADNVTVDNGSGTDYVVASDDDGTAQHQYVKVEFGPDNTQTKVTASVGLPVSPVQEVAGVGVGAAADAEATGNGSVIAILKRLRTLLGTGTSSLLKAEDAAHASGDAGVMAVGVRKDTASALAGTDGDYIPMIFDSAGRLHVNVGSMPAAARTTDTISSVPATDAIMNNLTALTPKFKSVTVAASSIDSVVVAAVASKKIRVVAISITCGATATVLTLESDEATDVRLDKIQMAANGGKVLPFNQAGWFETAAGSALIATTGAGSDTEITLTYVEV